MEIRTCGWSSNMGAVSSDAIVCAVGIAPMRRTPDRPPRMLASS